MLNYFSTYNYYINHTLSIYKFILGNSIFIMVLFLIKFIIIIIAFIMILIFIFIIIFL